MDLNKAFRAMQYSEEWRNYIQAAAMFEGVEFTPELLAEVTKKHLDDIVMDPDTMEISVKASVGESVIQTVADFSPPVKDAEELEERILALENRARLLEDTVSLDTQRSKEIVANGRD